MEVWCYDDTNINTLFTSCSCNLEYNVPFYFKHYPFTIVFVFLSIGSQFEYEALNIHNRYRAIHNAPPMTLNCEMSRNATAYAQKLADMDSLVPSGYNERPEQGENLSLGCYDNREQSAEEVVKVWYGSLFL